MLRRPRRRVHASWARSLAAQRCSDARRGFDVRRALLRVVVKRHVDAQAIDLAVDRLLDVDLDLQPYEPLSRERPIRTTRTKSGRRTPIVLSGLTSWRDYRGGRGRSGLELGAGRAGEERTGEMCRRLRLGKSTGRAWLLPAFSDDC